MKVWLAKRRRVSPRDPIIPAYQSSRHPAPERNVSPALQRSNPATPLISRRPDAIRIIIRPGRNASASDDGRSAPNNQPGVNT
jgi:hypothetical protein